MPEEPPRLGLNENHERHLLAGCQHAARLLRELEDILSASEHPPALPRYAGGLGPAERKVARDYARQLHEHLVQVLFAAGIALPPPPIDAIRALTATLTALDITFEEMRGRYMHGYGAVPPEASDTLDGLVTHLQGIVRELAALVAHDADDTLPSRIAHLPAEHPLRHDLQVLERIITEHGLVDARPMLAAVVARAADPGYEVAVVGRVSSGKSSLLNQLLGAPVLPVGVLPVTAVPTRLRRGSPARLRVTNAHGRTEDWPPEHIAELVTEEHNRGNEKRLTRIVLEYPSALLPEGVTFVDTPGLGSLAASGAAQTLAYLPRCDHGTLLVDASAPLGEEDLGVLVMLREAGIATSVLLSKADLLSEADLARVEAFVRGEVERRVGTGIPVRPVSARPSHAHLLATWIDDEVRPLEATAQANAMRAFAAKVCVLRERTAGALARRLGRGARPGEAQPAATFETRIRATGAQIERMSRDVAGLPGLAPAIAANALSAAAAALAEAAGAGAAGDEAMARVRSALLRAGLEPVEVVARQLRSLIEEVRTTLGATTRALGAAPVDVDVSLAERGAPAVDLPPMSLSPTPPAWARASRMLVARWARREVHEACAASVDASVLAHLHVVRAWAAGVLDEIRRVFESESRSLLVHLSALPDAAPGDGAEGAIARDIEWLRGRPGEAAAEPIRASPAGGRRP